ncbi:MAG: N-acetylmuramoyl-L-alanine amidase [bacterium]|nr:N-acetylmuramoyl-L-alanine amidase [bacterium]
MLQKLRKVTSILLMALLIVLEFSVPNVSATAANSHMAFTKKTTTLKAGKTYTYQTNMPKEHTKWTVSNSKIASISKDGKLTAKKYGQVTVTATYQTKKVSCKVTITPKKIIGLDAGHQAHQNKGLEPIGPGSKTKKPKVSSGTSGVATKVNEYELNLTVAKKLRTELENRGYKVIMTRTSHKVNISNKERALLLNKHHCDLVIRLHADGSDNSRETGASTLYTSTHNRYVKKSLSKKNKRLATTILTSYCKETKIKNRGAVPRDDLTGNNYSKVPTIVLEMGFMSNAKEDRNMQKSSTQKKMVNGISNGIDKYFA